MPNRVNADVRPCVRPKCETHESPRVAKGPRVLVVSREALGPTVVRMIAKAGVWAVTRSVDDLGWVVTHVPSGCAMNYYGVRHRRALALKIMRELHRVAPDWRSDMSLLGTDPCAEARRIARDEANAHIKATMVRLYEANRSAVVPGCEVSR